MLALYHHGSSACAAKVRFALAEKQLEWDGHYVDLLKGEQFDPAFLAVNPKAVVPVLVHDGFVICESTLICEYINEIFPDRSIYPGDARARVAMRAWAKAVDEELHPACSALTYIVSHRHTILRNGAGSFENFLQQGGDEGRAARERKWQWIQQGIAAPGAADFIKLYIKSLQRMEHALQSSIWLCGEEFSMADISMAPYLFRLECLALDVFWSDGALPAVAAWYQRIQSRPTFESAFKRWMPESLAAEMRRNGEQSRAQILELIAA